jgi:exopolysaccharide biosynthesis polyprenyl glycosylphosphotransferase
MQGRIEDLTGAGAPARTLRIASPATRYDSIPSARSDYRRLYRIVALTDTVSITFAMLVAYWVRFGLRIPTGDFLSVLLGAPFVIAGVFAAFHLYDSHRFTPAEEFRRIILAVSLTLTGLVTFSFWSHSSFSREWLAVSWALALITALASRRVWHYWIGRARTKGRLSFSTLIVGTNEEAAHLASVMRRPAFGFKAIGMVTTSSLSAPASQLPIMGSVGDLRELIRETGAECVFVASSAMSPEEMGHVAKAVRLEGVEVRITATMPEVLASRLTVQPLGGLTALSLRPVRLTGTQVLAKRMFDLSVAGIGTLLLSPVFIGVAVAIKVSSSGPVFFRQRRVGHRGRPFTILKFRTMQVGADQMIDELREQHGVENLMFKLKDDPRVTAVGRFLRKVSLDELPQLINVIRGDMSLVGPRPPLPEEVTRYEDWQFDRLEVPPGITGLWQVSGRSELSFDDCVRLDLFYIENWSIAYDLYIVAKTLPALLSSRGAY